MVVEIGIPPQSTTQQRAFSQSLKEDLANICYHFLDMHVSSTYIGQSVRPLSSIILSDFHSVSVSETS